MVFKYKSIDVSGVLNEGTIDAINIEIAISSLQKRGLTVASIIPENKGISIFDNIAFFDRITNKDVVILSRQMATLFEAQVSALRIFQLLASQSENPALRKVLGEVVNDLQAGSPIADALAKHPKVFSLFYINMVKSGEESGKLNESFLYLADYLDRTYEITSKVKGALIYPIFVVFTFVAVMSLMLVFVIPKISVIIKESGQVMPIYT